MDARRAARALVAMLAAGLGLWLVGAATPAGAAPKTVEVVIQEDAAGVGQLVPASVTVAPGDTIRFSNRGTTAYNLAVDGDGYSAFLVPGADTGTGLNQSSYVAPQRLGRRTIFLTTPDPTRSEPKDGSVTVAAPGRPKPTATPRPTASGGTSTPRPGVTSTPAAAPTPAGSTPLPIPSFSLPPGATAAPSGAPPTFALPDPLATSPVPSPSGGAVVAGGGPLEPPSNRALGLPAALAAVLILGTGGAIGRVLLAEPTTGGRSAVA